MEKFPKIRFIIITVIVVTVVNLIALGIILRVWYHRDDKNPRIPGKDRGAMFIKERLKLSDEQFAMFNTDKKLFFDEQKKLYDSLEVYRIKMIRELASSHPDSSALYSLTAQMGSFHGQLKKNVVRHMLRLRSYCKPNQLPLLDSLYKEIIRTDSPWRNRRNPHEETKGKRVDFINATPASHVLFNDLQF